MYRKEGLGEEENREARLRCKVAIVGVYSLVNQTFTPLLHRAGGGNRPPDEKGNRPPDEKGNHPPDEKGNRLPDEKAE